MIDNLGWCKPYESKDGRVSFVMCEGEMSGAMVEGNEIDFGSDLPESEKWKILGRALGAGEDDDEEDCKNIVFLKSRECSCRSCQYYDICEQWADEDNEDEEEDEDE